MRHRSRLLEDLGISREELPQFPKEQLDSLISGLCDDGVNVRERTLFASRLLPAQEELNYEKVARLARDFHNGSWPEGWKPILVSRDLRILDGHHRWAAALSTNPQARVLVVWIDLDFRQLLRYAKQHSDLRRSVDEDCKEIPVAVPMENAKEFRRRYGA